MQENVLVKGNDIHQLETLLSAYQSHAEDMHALHLLSPLLAGQYLPFSNSALRPVCIMRILNDIIINERSEILEFGSGISTIIIGRLLKRNKIDARLITVEHNEVWTAFIRKAIISEALDDVISVIHAPLAACSLALNDNQWYDMKILDQRLEGISFDLVIVDGPPAYVVEKREARYPALPYIFSRLAGKYGLFFDDANRVGEKNILHKWEEEFNMKFSIAFKTMAYTVSGHDKNANLF